MSETHELSAAMARAFSSIEGAAKGKLNPAFRSKYADLAAVVDAIKPHLAEHGLWFRQVTHQVDGGVCVETVIHHSSGQSLACGPLFVPAAKQDPQGFGSALTYARRYSLMTAFGVPSQDDDGNASSKPAAPRQMLVEPSDEGAATQLLEALREAALSGPDALKQAFNALPTTREKAAVWQTHSQSLKRAAAAATQKDAA
jgi:hypothetical protein